MSSINHHYVPQLYLKGFTAENGRLQVFDKEYMGFKSDKQTPKTILFEKHRNTIEFQGSKTDKLEQLYGVLETPFGNFFDHVRSGISSEELISKHGIYLLKMFIAIQFWRLPLLDALSEKYMKLVDLKGFGRRIVINDIPIGEVDEVIKLIDTDKGFRHYFRSFILPILLFDFRVHEKDYDCWRLYTISHDSHGWDNFLTGDNPFIVQDIAEIFQFRTKLMFPLSKTQLITYSPEGANHKELPPIFSTKCSMVMNSQCHKYVVGANRDFMEKVIKLQDEAYGNNGGDRLRNELFEYI